MERQEAMDTNCWKGNSDKILGKKITHIESSLTLEQAAQGGWGICMLRNTLDWTKP